MGTLAKFLGCLLLQMTPGIRGKNFNNAVSGAKASDLPRQTAAAA